MNLLFSDFYGNNQEMMDTGREEFLDSIRKTNDFHEVDDGTFEHITSEDDYIIYRNDPLLRNKHNYYNAAEVPDEGDTDVLSVAAMAGVVGGVLEESNEDIPEKEYISMRKAIEEAKSDRPTKRKMAVNGKRILSPFEKWVDDVLAGRKSYNDDL